MSNKHPTNSFKKGDPRINRKGRPKSFNALRELGLAISNEVALSHDKPLVINGHVVTVAEAILRSWATSNRPELQRAFVELCYGKVPDEQNINVKEPITFRVIYEEK